MLQSDLPVLPESKSLKVIISVTGIYGVCDIMPRSWVIFKTLTCKYLQDVKRLYLEGIKQQHWQIIIVKTSSLHLCVTSQFIFMERFCLFLRML